MRAALHQLQGDEDKPPEDEEPAEQEPAGIGMTQPLVLAYKYQW